MTTIDYKTWFSRFVGVLEQVTLVPVMTFTFYGRNGIYYQCPCGQEDHFAARYYVPEGLSQVLSPVLTCFETNKQWLVREPFPADLIREEEVNYLSLLKKSSALVEKVTQKRGRNDKTKAFLWETHGIPGEIVDDCWEKRPL